ncbi:MAG: hypothetical protein KUG68_07870 [Flavobacteriaceae bacterium]|nr:hypothetical protein [Flavobacteriaceae bacterium]
MKSANHNIQKVFLEVNTQTSKKAYDLKDTIDDFLKEHLFPFIDGYFDSLDFNSNVSYQLEGLELSLSVHGDLKIKDMIPNLKKQLDKVFLTDNSNVLKLQSKKSFNKLSESENKVNTLLYFLEHGNYPWWVENITNTNQSVEALLYDCIESPEFIIAFKRKLEGSIFKERTILQVSNVFLSLLILKSSNHSKKSTLSFIKSKRFNSLLVKSDKKFKHPIWSFLIDYSQSNSQSNKKIEQNFFGTIKKISSNKGSKNNNSLIKIIEEFDKATLFHKYSTEDFTKIIQQQKHSAVLLDSEKNQKNHKSKEETSGINLRKKAAKDQLKTDNSSIKKDSTQKKSNKDLSNSKKLKKDIEIIQNKEELESSTIKETLETNISELPIVKENPTSEEKTISINDGLLKQEGAFYVENAGLILLHPFLKSFFENCSLLDEQQKINNPTLAIHLLHYLATGKEKQYEHLQLMEKFLCVLPIQHPISREVVLSDEIKEKAKELLEAVLKHLPMLKSTSVGLFQNEFLQRPGKLIIENNTTKLIIEQKTQDLLLKNIPWNISVVKLPWHKRLFFVDWLN